MKFASFAGLALVVAVSAYLAATKPFGVVYVDLGDGRGPAAIRKAYDVSDLAGLALSKKINERVVGDSHVLRRPDAIGLELGQFVTEGPEKNKVLACNMYDRIELTFQAQGIAVNGETPQMVVQGNCKNNPENIPMMAPIWIPVNEILKHPTSEMDFSFFDQESVSVNFSYVGDDWPKEWILQSLRLFNSRQPASEVAIDRSEIRMAAPQSILLEF